MQTEILRYFQGISTPFLDKLAEGITILGESWISIIVLTFFYWTRSKKTGFRLAAVFIFSSLLNNVLKLVFRFPRPFEKLDFIRGKRLHTATGYAFPSGHTQNAATFFTAAALLIRRPWAAVFAVLLSLAVGISRVYLGVHWPADAAAGLILGAGSAVFFSYAAERYYDDFPRLKKGLLLLESLVLAVTLILYILDLLYFRGGVKLNDFFKMSGISLGVFGGFLLDISGSDFDPGSGSPKVKIIRYTAGLALTALLLFGLKLLLPASPGFYFLRYGISGFWVTFLWPTLGIRLGLFSAADGKKIIDNCS